jgi:hypothetical protein
LPEVTAGRDRVGFLVNELSHVLITQNYLIGGNMRYVLLALALSLAGCDNSTPKIAAPQRSALEKAKGVEQTVQQSADETKKKSEEAEK